MKKIFHLIKNMNGHSVWIALLIQLTTTIFIGGRWAGAIEARITSLEHTVATLLTAK